MINFGKYFNGLEFNQELHRYTLDGQILTPVTNAVHEYSNDPNFYDIAKRIAINTGQDVEEILEDWKNKRIDGANTGTKIHNYAENYVKSKYFYDDINFLISSKRERKIISFFEMIDKMGYYPVGTEMRMYLKKYLLAGTLDLLLYNTFTKNFVICDYKTNKNLFKDYGRKMKPPFDFLLNTNFNKYSIQLSFYKIMLQSINIDVENLWIIWVREHNFIVLPVNDYSDIIIKDYENRKFNKQDKK